MPFRYSGTEQQSFSRWDPNNSVADEFLRLIGDLLSPGTVEPASPPRQSPAHSIYGSERLAVKSPVEEGTEEGSDWDERADEQWSDSSNPLSITPPPTPVAMVQAPPLVSVAWMLGIHSLNTEAPASAEQQKSVEKVAADLRLTATAQPFIPAALETPPSIAATQIDSFVPPNAIEAREAVTSGRIQNVDSHPLQAAPSQLPSQPTVEAQRFENQPVPQELAPTALVAASRDGKRREAPVAFRISVALPDQMKTGAAPKDSEQSMTPTPVVESPQLPTKISGVRSPAEAPRTMPLTFQPEKSGSISEVQPSVPVNEAAADGRADVEDVTKPPLRSNAQTAVVEQPAASREGTFRDEHVNAYPVQKISSSRNSPSQPEPTAEKSDGPHLEAVARVRSSAGNESPPFSVPQSSPPKTEAPADVAPLRPTAVVLDPEPTPIQKPRAPHAVKEISLALPSGQDIEVRVREHAGAVQVSVHTEDRDVRAALRQDLAELVSRLENRGLSTEVAEGPGQPIKSSDRSGSQPALESTAEHPMEAPTRIARPQEGSALMDNSGQQKQQNQRTPWELLMEHTRPRGASTDEWRAILESEQWQTN